MDASGHPIEMLFRSVFNPTQYPTRLGMNRNLDNTRRNVRMPQILINTFINTLPREAGIGMDTILQNSMNDTGGIRKKASEEFISKLKPPETLTDECSCGICQDDVTEEERETLLELPCKHVYHKDCILPWFEKSNTCPICRSEFEAKEIHPSIIQNVDASGANESVSGGIEGVEEMEGQMFTSNEDLDEIEGLLQTVIGSLNRHTAPTNILRAMSGLERIQIGPLMGTGQNVSNILMSDPPRRSSTINEDTILQEMILRSLRDT
jgi:hypothetical protein